VTEADPRVQPLAELRLRRYASEHSADHLTWQHFADEVVEDLALLDSLPAAVDQDAAEPGAQPRLQSADDAMEWLRSIVVPVYGDVRATRGLLWATSEIAHASRHGGDRTLWDRFETAKRLLDSDPRAYWKKAP
jgi:hypothetical protein